MSEILKFIGSALLFFWWVTGYVMNNMEYIPDNAKIYILEEHQTWVPNAEWANEIFEEQASVYISIKRSYENKIESTYAEIKNGKYKDFQLPEGWRKGDKKSEIVWGRNESLLRSWILPGENRWNSDGSWNW